MAIVPALLALAVGLAACSDGGEEEAEPATTAAATTEPAETEAARTAAPTDAEATEDDTSLEDEAADVRELINETVSDFGQVGSLEELEAALEEAAERFQAEADEFEAAAGGELEDERAELQSGLEALAGDMRDLADRVSSSELDDLPSLIEELDPANLESLDQLQQALAGIEERAGAATTG